MTFAQAAVDTAMTPNINTIIGGFAAVVGLFILREFRRLYDWRVKNEGLPAALHKLEQSVASLLSRLNRHCDDEERWQSSVETNLNKSANVAQIALSKVEENFGARFDTLEQKVDTITERRTKPR